MLTIALEDLKVLQGRLERPCWQGLSDILIRNLSSVPGPLQQNPSMALDLQAEVMFSRLAPAPLAIDAAQGNRSFCFAAVSAESSRSDLGGVAGVQHQIFSTHALCPGARSTAHVANKALAIASLRKPSMPAWNFDNRRDHPWPDQCPHRHTASSVSARNDQCLRIHQLLEQMRIACSVVSATRLFASPSEDALGSIHRRPRLVQVDLQPAHCGEEVVIELVACWFSSNRPRRSIQGE